MCSWVFIVDRGFLVSELIREGSILYSRKELFVKLETPGSSETILPTLSGVPNPWISKYGSPLESSGVIFFTVLLAPLKRGWLSVSRLSVSKSASNENAKISLIFCFILSFNQIFKVSYNSRMKKIFTIGHSTKKAEELIKILKYYEIEILVDIRTVPKSRHNAQFEGFKLEESLNNEGISYIHLQQLGGLRRPKKDSPNLEWKNTTFRGYADHMETEEFKQGLALLKNIAEGHKTVIMCAEAVPWRCHRNLVADALKVEDWEVVHIMTEKIANKHELTPFIKVSRGKITYPKS